MDNFSPQDAKKQVGVLLKKAVEIGSSDVFLAPGVPPAYKQDGKTLFFPKQSPCATIFIEAYLSTILGEVENNFFRENQELDMAITIDGIGRFRINVFMQLSGVSIAFRYVPGAIPSFESLGIPESLKKVVKYANGLILVTGAMGSGKTTTLASLIDLINKEQNRHIITIEDPIEFIYHHKNSLIEQREIGVHAKNFQTAMRSTLRQSADVIMLGEMRDAETITMALTAAETGSLVISTLHTSGVSKTINRIIGMFSAEKQDQIRFQLSEVLRCCLWQSLLPKKDGEKGLVPAFEVLFNNYAIGNMIREKKTFQIPTAIETHRNEGMIAMPQYLKFLIQGGKINASDAFRLAPEDAELRSMATAETNISSNTDGLKE